MKIDDVSLTIFAWDNIPVTTYHQGATAASGSNLGLLRIRTDAGLEGHAFLGSASNPAAMDGPQLIRSLKPMLMGKNPLERERIHAGMRLVNRTVSYRTIGAVDTALWDLAGKIAGLPVHALMGTFRTTIPAYASSQVLPDAAAYVDQAQAFKAAGWQAYKIHPPRDPDHDIRVCQAVRKAVGDDYRLMLDSTWSYDYTDALRVGRDHGHRIPGRRAGHLSDLADREGHRLSARRYPQQGRPDDDAEDRASGRGVRAEVRSPPLRQLTEQPGKSASLSGLAEHHDVGGAAARRGPQIRHGEGTADRRERPDARAD
jgi:hypothetical protein